MAGPQQPPYRIGFVIEYSIGHVTFAHMLQRVVAADPTVEASWHFVEPIGKASALGNYWSLLDNYTVRSSWRGRRLVGRGRQLDALLLHTQTLSLFFPPLMSRVPTVISTDATPENIDEVSVGYMHAVQADRVEAAKRRVMGAIYRRAAYVMPWNEWAARSMTQSYGVDRRRCRVVRPGLDVRSWPVHPRRSSGPLRVLFVGGDFGRKGGQDLLAALGRLEVAWECDVVTKSEVAEEGRLRVHRGLQAGDPQLRDLFARADVFVLPTIGDAMPWVLIEAMCAGLPSVSTRVGAVPEMVEDGVNGLLVSPGDVSGLESALRYLAQHPDERARMGRAARRRAEEQYDEAVNGPAVLELLKSAAGPRSAA